MKVLPPLEVWTGLGGGGYCMCKDGMCFRKMSQLFLNCENLQWWSPSMNDVWEIKKEELKNKRAKKEQPVPDTEPGQSW